MPKWWRVIRVDNTTRALLTRLQAPAAIVTNRRGGKTVTIDCMLIVLRLKRLAGHSGGTADDLVVPWSRLSNIAHTVFQISGPDLKEFCTLP